MKNYKLYEILFVTTLLLTSCIKTKDRKEKQFHSQLIVKNNTNFDLTIRTFCNNNLVFMGQSSFQIIEKNSFKLYSNSFGSECPPPPIWGLISLCVDSVVIDFGNKKRLIHTKKESMISPLINNSLDIENIKSTQLNNANSDCVFNYTIADADFARATLIN